MYGIQALHEKKYGEGNEDKLKNGVENSTNPKREFPQGEFPGFAGKRPAQGSNRRHEQIVHQGIHNRLKRSANNHPDGKV